MTYLNEPAALAYADQLQELLPRATDAEHDALMQVGALLGGLSCRGFVLDLNDALNAAEEEARLDCPWWSSPAEEGATAREREAYAWLSQARQIMATANARLAA